jgi:hypothetical protein
MNAQITIKEYTQQVILFLNTHWDHRGKEARKQSAILINKKLEELVSPLSMPVILTGDLNEGIHGPGVCQLRLATWRIVSGKTGTFVDWSKNRTAVIDFIMYRNLQPLQFCILPDEFKSGRMMSDHRPIFASFYLNNLPASADMAAVHPDEMRRKLREAAEKRMMGKIEEPKKVIEEQKEKGMTENFIQSKEQVINKTKEIEVEIDDELKKALALSLQPSDSV